jgi:hypothetical protein
MICNNFSLFTFFHILPNNRVLVWPRTYRTHVFQRYLYITKKLLSFIFTHQWKDEGIRSWFNWTVEAEKRWTGPLRTEYVWGRDVLDSIQNQDELNVQKRSSCLTDLDCLAEAILASKLWVLCFKDCYCSLYTCSYLLRELFSSKVNLQVLCRDKHEQ